jgi:hypothetical protein
MRPTPVRPMSWSECANCVDADGSEMQTMVMTRAEMDQIMHECKRRAEEDEQTTDMHTMMQLNTLLTHAMHCASHTVMGVEESLLWIHTQQLWERYAVGLLCRAANAVHTSSTVYASMPRMTVAVAPHILTHHQFMSQQPGTEPVRVS